MCAVITYKRRRKYLSDASASPMLHSVMVQHHCASACATKDSAVKASGKRKARSGRPRLSRLAAQHRSRFTCVQAGGQGKLQLCLVLLGRDQIGRRLADNAKPHGSCGSVSMGTGREQRRADTACVCFFVERRESRTQSMSKKEKVSSDLLIVW